MRGMGQKVGVGMIANGGLGVVLMVEMVVVVEQGVVERVRELAGASRQMTRSQAARILTGLGLPSGRQGFQHLLTGLPAVESGLTWQVNITSIYPIKQRLQQCGNLLGRMLAHIEDLHGTFPQNG